MQHRKAIKARAREGFKRQYVTSLGLYAAQYLVVTAGNLVPAFMLRRDVVAGSAKSVVSVLMEIFARALVFLPFELAVSMIGIGVCGGFTCIYRRRIVRVVESFLILRGPFRRNLGTLLKKYLLMRAWTLPFQAISAGLINYALIHYGNPGAGNTVYLTLIGPALLVMLFSFVLGIVKMLGYSLTEFLLAEYPEIRMGEAIRLSVRMTKGHKGKLFAMTLSIFGWIIMGAIVFMLLLASRVEPDPVTFTGWLIAGLISAGLLAVFWLGPYLQTSLAGLYTELRDQAVTTGVVSLSELGESRMRVCG